jgi:hypothetical protein
MLACVGQKQLIQEIIIVEEIKAQLVVWYGVESSNISLQEQRRPLKPLLRSSPTAPIIAICTAEHQ